MKIVKLLLFLVCCVNSKANSTLKELENVEVTDCGILDLSNKNLIDIGGISNLKVKYRGNIASINNIWPLMIILDNNLIKTIPAEIENLQNLFLLSVSKNQITILPKGLEKLNNLIVLNLSCNQISKFPEAVKSLPNLERLNISKNPLKALPSQIFKEKLEIIF